MSLSSTVFALTASHFLFARAKEKVTKKKARPASGFRCAKLPSLRHCSEGRHGGPSLPRRPRPSLLVWHLCQTPLSTAPPLGLLTGSGIAVSERYVEGRAISKRELKARALRPSRNALALFLKYKSHRRRQTLRQEAEWNRCGRG